MAHYIGVTGGRDFHNRDVVFEVLQVLHWFYGEDLRVIHGAAKGADMLAESVCDQLGVPTRQFAADWETLGKKAGVIRNQHMANLLAKWRDAGHTVQVLAFPGGTGTLNMTSEARARSIAVDEIRP